MSISSILALVLAGGAAKAKSSQVARPSEARIAALEGERDRQYEENVGLIARIAELEGDVARANIQYRRDQDLIDIWRKRALFAEAPAGALVPAGPDFRPPIQSRPAHIVERQSTAAQERHAVVMRQAQAQQLAQYADQSLLAQQYNAQQAMNAQGFYRQGLAGLGLLGAQNLDAGLWCNCVPSRSQVWATSDPE
jgi:hypothetical protein